MLSEYNKEDENGKYRELELRNRNPAFNKTTRPNLYYPIYVNEETGNVSVEKSDKYSIEVFPLNSEGEDSCWTWGVTKFKENNELLLSRKTGEGNWRVFRKDYLLDENGDVATTLPKSLWIDKEFNNDYGKKAIKKFLGDAKIFDFPKSAELIKRTIDIGTSEDDIILDFFGGSGPTGQAAIELNQSGGNRKFILIQIPEATDEKSEAYKAGYKKISDITIERNKRVIEKLIEEKKNQQPDLFTNGHKEDAIKGLGFKVFKLVKSNFPRVEFAPDPEKTDEENIGLLKKYISDKEAQLVTAFNRDELMTEILLKKGFNLNYTTEKQQQFKKNEIYLATDGEKETLICLDVTIRTETVEYFKKHTDKKFICLERALDTTKKYNLKHYMGDMFNAF